MRLEKKGPLLAGSALGRNLAALNTMIVAPGLPRQGGIMMIEGLRGTMIDEVMMFVEALTLIMTVVGTMTDVGTTEGARMNATTTGSQDMPTGMVDAGAERVELATGISGSYPGCCGTRLTLFPILARFLGPQNGVSSYRSEMWSSKSYMDMHPLFVLDLVAGLDRCTETGVVLLARGMTLILPLWTFARP